MHVVLHEPEIPPNTGSIARLCAATDTVLHLVGRLGFSLDNRYLKRAGLDYWPDVKMIVHQSFERFCKNYSMDRMWFFSARAGKPYYETCFKPSDILVFGSETRGLPESILRQAEDRILTIPINDKVRSLNLANSVSIALYEALRQCPSEMPALRRPRLEIAEAGGGER